MITTQVIFGLALVGGFLYLLRKINQGNSIKTLEISDLESNLKDLKDETLTYEINNKNEAITRVRDGRQVHNYQLKPLK